MTEELKASSLIPASPNRIYSAWLDERQHSAFTGSRSMVEPWVGGRFSVSDGYAFGSFVELDTGRRIIMTWRSTDFPDDAADSKVEVRLEPVAGGTRVVIDHAEIPEGQADQYRKGWRTNYLEPMKRFFSKPGAMRAAIQAASKAGLLPVPGAHREALLPRRGPVPASTAQRVGPLHPEASGAKPKAVRKAKPKPPVKAKGRAGKPPPSNKKAAAKVPSKGPAASRKKPTKKKPPEKKATPARKGKAPARKAAAPKKKRVAPKGGAAKAGGRTPARTKSVPDKGRKSAPTKAAARRAEPRKKPAKPAKKATARPAKKRSTKKR